MNDRGAVRLGLLIVLLGAGCAVHYFDPATGTEHVWGVGHLKMKVGPPDEGLQAVVRGSDVVGLSLGRADQQTYFTLGWHRTQRLDVLQESTAIRLAWPDGDFVNVRVGSTFPFSPGEAAAKEVAR